MRAKEEEVSAVKKGREEDEPSASKGNKNEDELRVSKREPEEKGTRLPTRDKFEEESSTWKRDKKEDEWNTLVMDEKEDERDMLKSDEKEDEWNASKCDEKNDEQNTLKWGLKEDEWYSLKRDEKEDNQKMVEKEDGQKNKLNMDEKEDQPKALKKDERENEQSVLERDKKEDKPGFSTRNKEEDEPGALKWEAKEDEQNIPNRDTEEEDASVPNIDKIENERSMLTRDEKEENTSVSKRDKIEDENSLLKRNEKEDYTSVPIRDAIESEHSVLKRDEKEDDLSFTVKVKVEEPKTPVSNTKEGEICVKKMERKEEAGGQEDQSSPTYGVFEEAVRVAGEAFQNMYFTGPILPQSPNPRHRRTQSEVGTSGHKRTNSFQRLKMQMQKAWRGVSNLREDSRPSFNPEVLANQKRQWYQLHSSKAMDQTKFKEPTSLFEHFIIVGLHPETNLEAVEEAFAKRKKWEMEMAKSETRDFRMLQYRGPQLPTLEPQILFKYPPGKKLAMRPKDLATFCFPGGIKARLLERTPSLSDLNELVYGQEHLGRDDSSFIFSLKVADDATLYGVCLHVSEIVQRPPGILSTLSPLHSSGGGSRFLISAPRCYCLLTRVTCFELHFEMLNSMIAQERLKRITGFVSEMSLVASDCAPIASRLNDQMNENHDSPGRDYLNDWMASAIPVDSVIALTAAAAGFISDDEITSSQKIPESQSPDSATACDASDASHVKEIERYGRETSQCCDNASEAFENHSDAPDRMCGSYENGQASPEVGTFDSSRTQPIERIESSESVFSSARSMVSDDVDDTDLSNSETDFGDDLIMKWARDHRNDLLQIVCGYHSMAIPSRGSEIVFQPLEHLQAIEYMRPTVSALGFSEEYLDSCDASEVNAKLAAAEEVLALSIWTTATICRVLSLESVLALLAGILLEKQVVVVCPNLGVLSATVLSLVPMIRPFQWQSLLLPVLPGRMFDFLDAPVPFLVGVQSKPTDLKIKTSNLIQVNVLSDQVKSCHLPSLPRRRELMAQLSPIYARLAYQSSVARKHPVYRCNEVQAEAAMQFLTVMRQYMESLCSDLRSHTITSVQSNSDRVSLLLKDSFIDSFPGRDRPFIKLFIDTQLFSVLSDSRLSSFENGRL